jgi:DNA gyrase/topoisomerase IV subunit A
LLLHQKGIGVGTASTIPSFKLDSVIAATERLIKTPEVVDLEVAKMLVPYFAQNATIINRQELPFIFTHKPRDGKPASIFHCRPCKTSDSNR